MTRNLLLTGGAGQLGTALQKLEWPSDINLLAPPRAELDLNERLSVQGFLSNHQIDGIINAGAYTAVDEAEANREIAWRVNAEAPGLFAEFAARTNIPLIHVSTDYVFSGDKSAPYDEDDAVGPVSVYGVSKEAGERAIRATGARHLIIRTAWVLSATGKNFLKTMLRLAEDRDSLRIVADQQGSPTSADDLAKVIQTLAGRHLSDRAAPSGTYHCVNSGFATWAELASTLFDISAGYGGPVARVEPIGTADYPTAAKRPMNSRLLTTKLERDFGQRLPDWRDAISPIIFDVLKRVS